MDRPVVTDTGPLLHLSQADLLELLELTGEILVPRAVIDELEPGSIDVSELGLAVGGVEFDTDSVYPHLDTGETAALLVCSGRDAVLLTDDLDARNTAKEEGIEVHGSVGVVLYGHSEGGVVRRGRKTRPSGVEDGHEPVSLDTAHRARGRLGRIRRCRVVATGSVRPWVDSSRGYPAGLPRASS